MDSPVSHTVPKKNCVITLMFAVEDDAFALAVKDNIDIAVKDIKDKRYTFQLNET